MIVTLGQKVRDTITGLEGIAVCRTEWLYGCVRIGIQPQGVKDGKTFPLEHVDEPQVELVDEIPKDAKKDRPAGPRDEPQRASDPSR